MIDYLEKIKVESSDPVEDDLAFFRGLTSALLILLPFWALVAWAVFYFG